MKKIVFLLLSILALTIASTAANAGIPGVRMHGNCVELAGYVLDVGGHSVAIATNGREIHVPVNIINLGTFRLPLELASESRRPVYIQIRSTGGAARIIFLSIAPRPLSKAEE